MVIIKCNAALPDDERRHLEINIHDQAADGVIVLPYFCDLLTVTPGSDSIQILRQDDRAIFMEDLANERNRVAELEAELAMAMEYIRANKECETCTHNFKANPCEDVFCENCPETACVCRTCDGYSNWKWRGAHANDRRG